MGRASGVPDVPGGSGGPRSWLLPPAARTDASPASPPSPPNPPKGRCATMCALPLPGFPGPNERLAETDWSGYLVDSNHRYDEGFERDPPLRERPPRQLRQRQRPTGLRYKAQPALAGKDWRHVGVAAGPEQAVAQAHDPQADQQQHPGPELRQRDRKSTRLNSSHGYISYAV